ncbi:F-box protein [Cardamine amara subsp. amara]|uniref:F-box protein n=1 Tax=Cardamine amara subsp. amara TaxID=228776 RepID=A0ABD0ZRX2_CARAN
MAGTDAQRIKRVRAETKGLKQSRAEPGDVTDAHGVFIDILSRISVKSLMSYRTLSKFWYDSIKNKYFAELQLAQSRKNPSFIVCPVMDSTMRLYTMEVGGRLELSPLNNIDPPERSREEYMFMIASFNGLICCVNQLCDKDIESKFRDLQIWICNPCTGEALLLPQGTPSFVLEPSVGVAFGSDISDYRIFRIFCTGNKDSGKWVNECEMYSSITGSWKNIGRVPEVPLNSGLRPYRSTHVFVGGKVYWLVSLEEPGKILSVDLEGKFDVINLPEYSDDLRGDDKITDATHLTIFQGSLSVVVLHVDHMDIWILQEDGSWVDHIHPMDYDEEEDDMVLGITSVKNQILCMTSTHWWIYDMDTRIWRYKRGPRTGLVNPAAFPFTESILPCNGGVRL